MSNKSTFSFKLTNLFTNDVSSELSTPTDKLDFLKVLNLTNGTGLNKAEQIFHDQRTLALSANEELDLAGGLNDVFGNLITFTKIKSIIVFADPANTNNVLVGGAAVNAVPIFNDVTDKAVVKPGGMLWLYDPTIAGFTVTPATGDLLRLENGGAGTPVTFDLIIVGETS